MKKTGSSVFEDFKSLDGDEKKKFNELLVKNLVEKLTSKRKDRRNFSPSEIKLSVPIHFKKKNDKYVLDGKYSQNIVKKVKEGFSKHDVLPFWEKLKNKTSSFKETAYVLTLIDSSEILLSKLFSPTTVGIDFLIVDIDSSGLSVPAWLSEDNEKINLQDVVSKENYKKINEVSEVFVSPDFILGSPTTFAIIDDSIYTIIF